MYSNVRILLIYFQCLYLYSSCMSSSLPPPGVWERKDSPQQQLEPFWKVHPGELPGERHRERVRSQTQMLYVSLEKRGKREKQVLI